MNFNAYLGLDVHKQTIGVAIADGRTSDVRFYGGINNTPDAVAAVLKKIGERYGKLHVVYEAGPCGYGLYRQINGAGHVCAVVSPAHTLRRGGDRVKTDRPDAILLARLARAGELTSVWVPDQTTRRCAISSGPVRSLSKRSGKHVNAFRAFSCATTADAFSGGGRGTGIQRSPHRLGRSPSASWIVTPRRSREGTCAPIRHLKAPFVSQGAFRVSMG